MNGTAGSWMGDTSGRRWQLHPVALQAQLASRHRVEVSPRLPGRGWWRRRPWAGFLFSAICIPATGPAWHSWPPQPAA